jgi:Tfp pilus assembly protein PilE
MTRSRRRRPGFTYLELQVAFVVLAIALAGLCPLVVTQWKLTNKIVSRFRPGATYYLVPQAEAMARKLGAAASIASADPGAVGTIDTAQPSFTVTVLSVDTSPTAEDVTAHVAVQAVPR